VKRWLLVGLALTAGCSDALEQTSSAGQVIGVVNSVDRTLSIISATDFTVSTRTWPGGGGSPTTIAGRGNVFVVPLGPADSAGVSFLRSGCRDLCPLSDFAFALPAGSGATGVAIQDDSVAWIANPNLHTVTRLNYLTGDTTSIAVGVYPQAVAIVGTRIFVVNGNLVSGTPAGPSWLTSFDCCSVTTSDSIPLTGTNARFAVVGDDSLLYVVASGHVGAADGKLSIVDPKAPAAHGEIAVLNGLGESPGPAAFHPSGRLLISSQTEGILEVYVPTRSLTRGPGNGVKPGGDGVSGLAVDLRGRVYAVPALPPPEFCAVRGVVHVLSAPPDYRDFRTVTVGFCPASAAVAATP